MRFLRATHLVSMFQYKEDAERFYYALLKRLDKFNLTVAEEKTEIIRFGRFAEIARRKARLGKPETFNFESSARRTGRNSGRR